MPFAPAISCKVSTASVTRWIATAQLHFDIERAAGLDERDSFDAVLSQPGACAVDLRRSRRDAHLHGLEGAHARARVAGAAGFHELDRAIERGLRIAEQAA